MSSDEVRIPVSVTDGEHARLADRFGEEAHNVLLLAPPMEPCSESACADLMSISPPDEADVLYVTYVRSPDECVDSWRNRVADGRPARLGVVDVGGSTRSAAAGSAGAVDPADDLTVRPVSSPGNLTDVGIKVSEYLAAWEGDGNRTVICLHSLTPLLQYVDLERAFRFLHVLTGRVRSTDSFAHYHMDPSAHDDRTRNTIMALFDAAVAWDGQEWQIRSR